MQNQVSVEICVESVSAGMAAQRGGAHRIELCEQLRVGGLTPSHELMRQARARVSVPVYAMIRPRGGNYCYSDDEFKLMEQQIDQAKSLKMDGLVLGVLTDQGQIDVQRTHRLVQLAQPLPVTFHRAFDETSDLEQSFEDVVCTGATRLLTSGGRNGILTSLRTLADLQSKSQQRIIVMPGGGINERNVGRVIRETRVKEIHSGLGNLKSRSSGSLPSGFEARVRKLVEQAELRRN